MLLFHRQPTVLTPQHYENRDEVWMCGYTARCIAQEEKHWKTATFEIGSDEVGGRQVHAYSLPLDGGQGPRHLVA